MLLAIDTSAGTSVAIVDRERGVLSEHSEADTRRHAEVVGQLISECLQESGVTVGELAGVAMGMGPGPFTGLRVGIAAGNAFAFGAGKPAVRVVSHDAIAFQHFSAGERGPLLVVTDARRREVYWSRYRGIDDAGLPERVGEIMALSVPFRPRGSRLPTSAMPQTDEAVFYQLYFQQPGVAEAELGRDPRRTLRMVLRTPTKEVNPLVTMVPRQGGWLSRMPEPTALPEWLSEADLDFYAKEFARTGFAGGLNWYRNIDRNWELLAPYARAQVQVPALYMAGERDLVLAFPGAKEMVENLKTFVPQLRRTIILPGCGHWTQQERPREVNAAMIEFLMGELRT